MPASATFLHLFNTVVSWEMVAVVKKQQPKLCFLKVLQLCVFISPVLQQQKNLEGYVGFASLPNQVYRKSVKRGFEFTLMVVGKKACCCACLCFYMNHFIVFIVVGIYKCSSMACVCLAVFIRGGHISHTFVVFIPVSVRIKVLSVELDDDHSSSPN